MAAARQFHAREGHLRNQRVRSRTFRRPWGTRASESMTRAGPGVRHNGAAHRQRCTAIRVGE